MKYKFIGENNTYCLELLAYNIMSKNDDLKYGQIIEVPDGNTSLIDALDASGLFNKVAVTVNKSKKEKKRGE